MPEAPLIYDLKTDENRPITQDDIERSTRFQTATIDYFAWESKLKAARSLIIQGKLKRERVQNALVALSDLVRSAEDM